MSLSLNGTSPHKARVGAQMNFLCGWISTTFTDLPHLWTRTYVEFAKITRASKSPHSDVEFSLYWKNHLSLSGWWFCSNKYGFFFKLTCLHWLKLTNFCLLSTFDDPLKIYTPVSMNILYCSYLNITFG